MWSYSRPCEPDWGLGCRCGWGLEEPLTSVKGRHVSLKRSSYGRGYRGGREEAHVCEASLLDRKSLIAFAVSELDSTSCFRNVNNPLAEETRRVAEGVSAQARAQLPVPDYSVQSFLPSRVQAI